MHADGFQVCMELVEEDRRRHKEEVELIGTVGRKCIADDGVRIGVASFTSKLSCQI